MPLWSRLRSKPPLGTPIDRTHPLAQGIHAFYANWEGSGATLHDCVSGMDMTIISGTTWGSAGDGAAVKCNQTNGGASGGILPAALKVGWPQTIAFGCRPIAAPSGDSLVFGISYDSTLSNNLFDVDVVSGLTTGNIEWNAAGSYRSGGIPSGTFVVGRDVVIGATVKPVGWSAYANGALVNFDTGTANSNPNYSATSQLTLGWTASAGRNPNMLVSWAAWWGRALTDAEHSALGNIWQLFQSQPVRRFLKPVGVGSATLTATAGTFTFTGNDANLLAGRLLGAGAGSYALTGQAASLLSGRVLPAAAGSYAFTGIDAGLLVSHILSAGTGVYTFTGIDAGLLAGRVLSAGAGAFTETGVAAGLLAARVLPAATGAYTFTGNAANLLVGRVIAASTGVYVLTGNAAGLVYGQPGAFTLVAGTGVFSLTGTDANLLAARVLPAATGAYTFTGNDAGLLAGHILSAAAGTYAFTGNAANLLAGRVVAASTGVYVLAGNDANLVYTPAGGYTLVAGTGSFALTGNDASFLVSRVLAAEAAVYVVTGQVAGLVWSGEHPAPTLTFRETLLAKLESISAVTAIVGTAIYPGALPMTHDLGDDGPAITYTVATYGRGHVLEGSDGTATARVQFSAWSFDAAQSDAITLAIWDALDRPPVNPWVAGGVEILSVVQVDESDQFEPPRAGGDQWVYQIVSEYAITHRTIIS